MPNRDDRRLIIIHSILRYETVVLSILLFASGCISNTSVRYYTLEWNSPLPPDEPPLCLQVTSVRAVDSLKRKEILIRKSSVEIEYYSSHLWASSLEELITHKLNQSFTCPQSGKIEPKLLLHVEILEFEEIESEPKPKVSAKLWVQFLSPQQMEILTQKSYAQVKQVNSTEVKDIVKALSECIDEIIVRIHQDALELSQ